MDARQTVGDFVERLLQRHDRTAIDTCVAPGLQEQFRTHWDQLLDAFPDLRVTVDGMVVEGDSVAARLTIEGTHRGAFAGVPPTGRRVSYASFRFYRVVEGRIAQTWAVQDRLGLLQQLGAVAVDETVEWAAGPGRTGHT